MTSILIPFYTYPDLASPTSQWQQLAQLAIAYPSIEIWAIVNPASGPGKVMDPNYKAGIQSLETAGVKLLGYVDTARATKTIAAVSAEMTSWFLFYGLDSIFFDNVENTKSQAYYWGLAQLVRGQEGKAFGNPGTAIPENYIGIFDTVVISENPAVPLMPLGGYDDKNFACLVYSQNTFNVGQVISAAIYYGYVYFTSGVPPNPYTGIPYLQQLCQTLIVFGMGPHHHSAFQASSEA
jgi:hypothetical protein